MARSAAQRQALAMSDEPTRRARERLTAIDWDAHPEAEADTRKRTPDVHIIVAGLALIAAVVLLVLAF
jgi:hypothetical protein